MKKLSTLLICLAFVSLPAFSLVRDEFAESSLDKNLKIKEYKRELIEDNFAENNKNKNRQDKINVSFDEIIPQTSNTARRKKTVIIDEKNFLPVKIQIKEGFSTKQNYDEGDYIDFVTLSDMKIKDKTYPKGSIIKARIETISKNQAGGAPSDLTIGNFSLDNIDFQGEINKTGANRSIWIYPATFAGDLIFLGLGELLLFIRGGHAKIKPKEIYTIYYKI